MDTPRFFVIVFVLLLGSQLPVTPGVAQNPADSTAVADSSAAEDSADTASSGVTATGPTGLEATTTAPWTPAHPVGSERGWESAVRLPLRVVTFPLTALGKGLEGTMASVEETNLVPRLTVSIASLPQAGILIGPASLGDDTGLGGEIGFKPPQLSGVFAAELSGSLERYTRTRIGLGMGPLQAFYLYDWRPREDFYGFEMDSDLGTITSYALRSQTFALSLAYPWRLVNGKQPRNQMRVWGGPRESTMRRGRAGNSFDETFPELAELRDKRQEHFRYGARLTTDHRSGTPHWGHGARVLLEAERYEGNTNDALAIRSGNTNAPSFSRFSGEFEGGVSFRRDPNTLRLELRAVDQVGDSGDSGYLLSDLMVLGGSSGLAGFEPGRFHDVDLLVGKLTYLFPLTRNLEFDMHAEAGGVFRNLKDADVGAFATCYGLALRPRTDAGPLATIGVDWSNESVRIRYTFGGVE
jgi:hypothetical protein